MSVFLFPFPRQAVFNVEKYSLSEATQIRIQPAFSPELKKAAIAFAVAMQEYFPGDLRVMAGRAQAGKALLTVKAVDSSLRPQEYRLVSGPDGIVLSGGDEAALYYGLLTLEQLLPQTGSYVPRFTIEDYPDFPQRGYMLDVSRTKVPTMTELYHFIDLLAKLKYNQLQLYIEHTFAFTAHERAWIDASPFTAQEIMQVEIYCRDRFIELVPNLNSFGHLGRWLNLREYRHLAECPDGFEMPEFGHRPAGVLTPNQASLDFMSGLYDEFLPNFSSRCFNIGCDETWELGQGKSKALCEEKGRERVYLDFLIELTKLAQAHGRTVMFWGDIILHRPELIGELPPDIIALNWGYEADHPFADETAKFAAAGVKFYVCPGTSSWNSLAGRTENCLKNLLNAAENGSKNHAEGWLMTDWGDGGHFQYAPLSWIGICAGAAYSWCLETNRNADIAEAVDMLITSDCAGVIGAFLHDFGNLYRKFDCYVHNNTIMHKSLVAKLDEKEKWLEETTVAEAGTALQELHHLREHLAGALPEADNGRLIVEELENAVRMTECALLKLLYLKGEAIDLGYLTDLLRRVIGKHEQLWLSRNRPGGLHESSGKLRAILDELVAAAARND
ncbi:MAG: family 20 glycosylhydrolase [Victivallales bacterium]|nr:family 20 glycosylhydrolase [Victivallales bacterium]